MRLAAPPPARLRGAHVPTAAPLPSPAALRGSCHGVSLTSSSACSLLPPSPLLSSRPARQLSARAAASSGSAAATDLGASRRRGDVYIVSEEEREAFHRDGYVHLRGVLSPEEVDALEVTYMKFLNQELVNAKDLGKDFCDMSGDYSRPLSEFNIVNVMLPTKYYAPLKGNPYEVRSASIAEQLHGPGMVPDYDQLLAKPPNKPGAVFHWHQDMAYWPATRDTRTCSFWMALDEVNEENGCIRFVPGTHKEAELRPHKPLMGDRKKSHTLVAELRDDDVAVPAIISRGDLTVHSERIVHGSGGNTSKHSWRRAYVIAYRTAETVAAERAMGFTHSHNDDIGVLNRVGWSESS